MGGVCTSAKKVSTLTSSSRMMVDAVGLKGDEGRSVRTGGTCTSARAVVVIDEQLKDDGGCSGYHRESSGA